VFDLDDWATLGTPDRTVENGMSTQTLTPTSRQNSNAPELPAAALDPASPRKSGLPQDAAVVGVVALSYFAGTRIGFELTPAEMPIAMFWPPNAILLAAFLLAPVRLWWAILLALIPAHFLAQMPTGVPVTTAAGWFVGNCGEALLGALLINRGSRQDGLFHSVTGVTRFLLFGFILAPLVTSFLDAAIVVGTSWGQDYWLLWIARLLSNMLAQLTIVPTIVVLGQRGVSRFDKKDAWNWIEAALLGVSIVVVSLFVFRGQLLLRTNIAALIYLPLPILLWASMRFGPAGLTASLLTISLVSIHGLMNGSGPFISASVTESVLSMQVFLCMIGVPLLLLAAVRMEQRQTERSLREMSRKLIDAQERERQHIAQELHDDIGQALTLAEIELDRMIVEAPDQSSSRDLSNLRDQKTLVSRGIWEISHGLYPSNLEYLGLVHALARMCSDLNDQTPIHVQCETKGVPDRLPADVSLCLFRVAQEALQNIVRHSHAKKVSLRLRLQDGRLFLQIADDGIGFNPSLTSSGLGFASIRERLKAMNGGIDIDSVAGQGTRLSAWVGPHHADDA